MKYLALLLLSVMMASLIDARRRRSVNTLSLTVDPPISVPGLTPEITISCNPAASKNVLMAVILHLEKVDENGTTTLVASQRINALLQAENNRTIAVGHLQSDNKDKTSSLTVTIATPILEDAGVYQCRYAAINEDFTFLSLGAKAEVNVTDIPPPDYKVIPQCNCKDILPEIEKLNVALRARADQPASPLDERCRTSFSARFAAKHGYEFIADRTAVFDNVISNKGNAYNSETGVFTAACDGQYFITASLRSHQRGDSGYVDGVITVGEEPQARTSVFLDSPIENYQSATNGVVLSLTAGQEVRVVVKTTSSGEFVGLEYSIFSGFFLFP
jgi:hypothetical protein